MISALLLSLPWVAILAFLLLAVRLPHDLPASEAGTGGGEEEWPSVTVIIPARNEARNIEKVLASLAASDYPDFDVIVVDDRSEDGTAELARAIDPGNAARILVVEGQELPEGWLGKPWACHQGAQRADGSLLLFTDADTWHGPLLLRRAVQAMREEDAHLLSVAGKQLMLSFWERLVQPQIFTGMLFRYWNQRRPLAPDRWRDAIANGQYILVDRATYQAEGGHEALKGEVVEDLRMAQRWVRKGRRVSLRMAEDAFATRMYTSLRELVEGWSKNVVLGGLATLPEGIVRRGAPAVLFLVGLLLWVVPPAVLVASTVSQMGDPIAAWAAVTVGVSLLTWVLISWRMEVAPVYGLLYPLGAAVSSYIFLRAWRRGGTVAWKGRSYDLELAQVTAEPE